MKLTDNTFAFNSLTKNWYDAEREMMWICWKLALKKFVKWHYQFWIYFWQVFRHLKPLCSRQQSSSQVKIHPGCDHNKEYTAQSHTDTHTHALWTKAAKYEQTVWHQRRTVLCRDAALWNLDFVLFIKSSNLLQITGLWMLSRKCELLKIIN